MKVINEQTCPLCGKQASCLLIDYGTYRDFKCVTCGRFVISRSADQFVENSTQLKQQLQSMSRSGLVSLLHIYVKSPANNPTLCVEIEDSGYWNKRSGSAPY